MMLALLLALAGAAPPAPDCNAAMTQLDMNICAGIEFDRADAELNSRWREAVRDAREMDAQPGRPGLSQYDALLASQRAWLRFRDAECARMALHYWGGSIVPLIRASCMTQLTRQRILQLREPNR